MAEAAGTILIAGSANNRIRRLFADGTITTIVGSASGGFGGDGDVATAARLRIPAAVASDAGGNLYVADTSNNVIRRVSPDGIISTVAGLVNSSGATTAGFNGDGSPATAYELSNPTSIAAASDCSLLIADTNNQRVRQLWPAVDYVITTHPAGLQITVDGQTMTAPATAGLLPGTSHRIDASSPQAGSTGIRYLKTSQPLDVSVSCGPGRVAANLSFQTQYALTAIASDGGTVSPLTGWQDAGSKLTMTATPVSGYVFAGWEGACSGTGTCQIVMDAPKTVRASFAVAQTLPASIDSGSIVGAGLSTPFVKALSPNGILTVFGSNFAASGTLKTVSDADLVSGAIGTKLAGVCVLVGGTPAPIFAVTPTQINFQAPQVPTSGNVSVQVVTGCGATNEFRSNAERVPALSAAPEFFYFAQQQGGRNPIAALNLSTGANVGQTGLLPNATFAPAKPGDILTLYGTGFGATSPPYGAGELPGDAAPVTGSVQVTLGSTVLNTADVLYAGVTPKNAGLYQLNIRIPEATPDGDQTLLISINGNASPSGAFLTIKR